jgi:hypothetical protein
MDQILVFLSSLMVYLKPVIEAAYGSGGPVLQAVVIVGALRYVNKALALVLPKIVELTPTPKDNEWLAKIMNSKVYKAFEYVLDLIPTPTNNPIVNKIMASKPYKVFSWLTDYLSSIKLPQSKS